MVQLWTWDMIARGFVTGAFLVMPPLLISWWLAHIVLSRHELWLRELADRVAKILEECKDEDG